MKTQRVETTTKSGTYFLRARRHVLHTRIQEKTLSTKTENKYAKIELRVFPLGFANGGKPSLIALRLSASFRLRFVQKFVIQLLLIFGGF